MIYKVWLTYEQLGTLSDLLTDAISEEWDMVDHADTPHFASLARDEANRLETIRSVLDVAMRGDPDNV